MSENVKYDVMQDENGKWWRMCLASQECIDKKQRFEKRADLVRHLKVKHGCEEVNVPQLSMGRPKSGETRIRLPSRRSRTQCEIQSTREKKLEKLNYDMPSWLSHKSGSVRTFLVQRRST